MPVTYTYSKAADFPGGTINAGKLDAEIRASAITIALQSVGVNADVVSVIFNAALPSADKTILDGDVAGPAGGLIAAHDNTADVDPVKTVKFETPQLINIKPGYLADRLWVFSQDLCDKCTWFGDAVRVVDEAAGVGTGVQTAFPLAHGSVIDVTHGRISDEDKLVPTAAQGGASYALEIKVDGVAQTEREFGEVAGGDYEVDYDTGIVTFFVPPVLAAVITASYFYSPANAGSVMYIRPPAGKKFILTDVEVQFAKDIVISSEVQVGIYTYNPALGAPPAKFLYPPSFSRFKRVIDYVNWTRGSFPIIPAFGGATRGFLQDIIQLRFEYRSTVELKSSLGMEIRIWLKNHQPLAGEQATFTYYGLMENET